jgi:hypothetical protein
LLSCLAVGLDTLNAAGAEPRNAARADGEPVAGVPGQEAPREWARIQEFDRWVYGGPGPEAVMAARGRLDFILRRRLDAVERVCDLSAPQKQKLELAGRGDIAGFLRQVAMTRAKFAAIEEEDAAVINGMRQEAGRLTEVFHIGPFYAGSLFGKAAKRVLTNERYAAYEILREIEQAGGYVGAVPRGAERLLRIRLTGTSFDDAGMARFGELTKLQQLALNGTRVTDASLFYVKDLRHLADLDLCSTAVTDEGLAHLAGLTNLEILYLVNTRVTDAGIDHLMKLERLKLIYLAGTQVGEAGIAKLKAALPNVEIRK